jgi:hypothetical protein
MDGGWSATHQEPGVVGPPPKYSSKVAGGTLVAAATPEANPGWSRHPRLHIWAGRPASEEFGFFLKKYIYIYMK